MSSVIRSRYVRWLLSAFLLLFLLHQTALLEANAVSSLIGNDYQYFADLLALPSSEGQGMEGKRQRLTMTELMKIHDSTCHDNDILHLSSVQSQDHQESRTRIPKVIHQADFDFTCRAGHDDATDNNNNNNKLDDKQAFKDIILQWKNLPNFHYYFHTRPQMEAFLYQDWPEFPHLTSIAMHCIPQRQGFVDLWKSLILWEYGGGVVDHDWVPKPQDNINNNNPNFQDLIQPHDQAILFMDVRSMTAEPHDRYTSVLFMEPKHPLAYYLVMRILSRISHHRHLHSISHSDWAFLSGSQVLDLSFVLFTVVDTSDAGFRMRHHTKQNRKFPPQCGEYRGRYNRTLRIVDAMDHVQPSDTIDMSTTTTTTSRLIQNYNYHDWRGNDVHYPSLNNHDDDDGDHDQQQQEQQWNATCMQRRLKYFVKSLPHLEPPVES